jgi:hypothetical protein
LGSDYGHRATANANAYPNTYADTADAVTNTEPKPVSIAKPLPGPKSFSNTRATS